LPHKITAQIDKTILEQLFKELGIWKRICDGTFSTSYLSPSPSGTYPLGTCRILLHFDKDHKHLATTHRIMNEKTAEIYHWDAKGFLLDDVWLWRQ